MSVHDNVENEYKAAHWHFVIAGVTLFIGVVECIWHYRGGKQHLKRARENPCQPPSLPIYSNKH